ncbi:hypothetical protein CWI37_0001p0020 [Hamiltosporidium tvaerminnensis]|uniref:Uncharacterized protein n=1 Tax=Hamiltosporidium tvaerminnensis TaxID=1176355 RepID=A0A4V2JVV8_9MICR|nr:hypothetical protein CWI37_0001p0020 [Hamiltosporidium tvaerminnensis]
MKGSVIHLEILTSELKILRNLNVTCFFVVKISKLTSECYGSIPGSCTNHLSYRKFA